mgnify:CR=1 FL=1
MHRTVEAAVNPVGHTQARRGVQLEAGRSRRDQIVNAQRTIEQAGGKFLGFVLNKRRYPVPEWLYRRF